MAELLLRVVDKVNEDIYLDAQCLKRGDVVVVCPDGWVWGTQELTNPAWRIVRIDMSVDEALAYLTPEVGGSKTAQARAFKIDVDALVRQDAAFDAFVTDETRGTEKLIMDAQVIEAVKVEKPPIEDPNKGEVIVEVIG